MATLQFIKGTNQGSQLALGRERTVLGRNPDCQVVINGTAVSRAHAHILFAEGRYYIEDLDSRNKTFVNNQEIAPHTHVPLKDKDKIKICDFQCEFSDPPTRKPLPPELRPEEPELAEDSPPSTTQVEASIGNLSSSILLETQPADKLKALLEITSNLSKTLELDPLLPKIVDNLFQLFKQADRGFIIFRDEATKRLLPRVVKTRRPHDESNARFSRHIVNQCMEKVQALLSDDASNDSRFAMSQSIADFRIRSVMCAPLWSQDGQAFGVIQLDTQDRLKKFTQDDLKLLMGVATQASIALENAKLHEDLVARERLKRDLELAREVQRSFLPTGAPDVAGYEFFMYYESAQEVGGDYYDFIPLPDGRLVAMLGDVAGKGVPAALLMAKISSDARFCMLTAPDPAAAITRLNAAMYAAGLTDRFVTLVAVVLDPSCHRLMFVNAGHPSPLVHRRATGQLEEATPRDATGLPVGVLPDFQYTSCEVFLEPGDGVLVFSDGITDAMDLENRQFQVRGVCAAVQGGAYTPRGLGERVVKVVKQHAAGRSQHDDMTLVCLGRSFQEISNDTGPPVVA